MEKWRVAKSAGGRNVSLFNIYIILHSILLYFFTTLIITTLLFLPSSSSSFFLLFAFDWLLKKAFLLRQRFCLRPAWGNTWFPYVFLDTWSPMQCCSCGLALPASVVYLTKENYCSNCAFARGQQMRMRLCHYQGCGKVATQAGAGGAVRFWCDKHVHLDRPFGNLGKAFDRIMVSLCVILCLFVVLLFGFPWAMCVACVIMLSRCLRER